MAIPTWTWSGRADRSERPDRPGRPDRSPSAEPAAEPPSRAPAADENDGSSAGDGGPEASPARLSRLSSEFELLSSPVRLAILLSLADRERPLRYTDLREAASIEDNGKLNYHLRRLEGLVDSRDDGDERGYVLTARGRRLLDGVPNVESSDSCRET